jgi:hypothetical protein
MMIGFKNSPADVRIVECRSIKAGQAGISVADNRCRAYIRTGGLRFPAGETFPRGLIDP